ncbi:MAG TPA: DUF6531 domain-containing protein [Acidimicrobiales bacterium]|nr:DUF6531 domain-containing protein [Acidimicrobiales bacterium]
MSITSANPDDLEQFVDRASRRRRALEADLSRLQGQQRAVVSGSPDYGVQSVALARASQIFSNLGQNEAFVGTIRRELLNADRDPKTGVASISSAAVADALRKAGLSAPPPPVEVEPSVLFGLPPTSGFVDDPICAANGNFVHAEIDLAFPANSSLLDMVRVYNSLASSTLGAFGPGWSSILDVRVAYVEGGVPRVHLPDGAIVPFVDRDGTGSGTLVGIGRSGLSLTPHEPGWTLRERHQRSWEFDADGILHAVVDGPAVVRLERDASGRVVDVVEDTSGRAIQVEWEDERVRALVSTDGRSVFYAYVDGVLASVDRPTGTMSYALDGDLITRLTDADGVVLAQNVYDEVGRVVEQTNEFGRTTRYQYSDLRTTVVSDTDGGPKNAFTHDRRGNLTSMVDGTGRAMRLTYDDAGRVVMVVDRTGAVTRFAYDDADNLVERVDADGWSMRWAWDDHGRLVAETHRNGETTVYEYDGSSRRPVRITEPNGGVITITLDERDQPTTITDADGVVTRFEWDADGQPVAVVDALGNRIVLEYEPSGELRRVVDGSGVETGFTSDSGGRAAEVIVAGAVEAYRYTAAGRPLSGTDAAGASWRATYGTNGRLDVFVDGEGSTIGFEWDVLGNMAAVVAPDGERFGFEYDLTGNVTATVLPDGNRVERVHDAEGRIVAFTDAAGRVWRRELDGLGRTVRATAPDGASTRYEYHRVGVVSRIDGPGGSITRTEVDSCGRVVAIVDGSGRRFEFEYSPAGRLLERRFPSGRTERLTYDAAGRLVAVAAGDAEERLTLDGRGRVIARETDRGRTELAYSDAGELVELRASDVSTVLERDAGGRVLAVVDGAGRRATFERDRRGHVVTARDAAGVESRFAYDARGRLAEQTAAGVSTRFGYDRTGYLHELTDPSGTLRRVLDPTGLVSQVRQPDGTSVDIARDAAARITGVFAGGDLISSLSYDAAGNLAEAVRSASGARSTLGRDGAGRLTSVQTPAGGFDLAYDDDGMIAGWAHGAFTTSVERDAGGRIAALVDSSAGRIVAPGATTKATSRDRSGRITGSPSGATYRYDDGGRLVEAVDQHGRHWSFTYGPDGLLASEEGPLGSRRYTRGLLGRIERIDEGGGSSTSFTYDGAGRRTAALRSDGGSVRWEWDLDGALRAIARTSPDGGVQRLDVALDGLGRPFRVGAADVVWDDALTGRPLQVGEQRYLHLAGATALATDGATWLGEIADPWGSEPGRDEPHVGFRGELAAWGLVWMGARVYDATTREFLSPDPLPPVPGRPAFASAYAYGFLDPVNHLDPSGARPISQAEYDALREREERGFLGNTWQAIKDDPWSALGAAVLITAGVVMIATGFGAGVGAAILVNAFAATALSAAFTGSVSPREVMISAATGLVPGGSSYRSAMAISAGVNMGVEGARQGFRGDFDPRAIAFQGGLGGTTGAASRYVSVRIDGVRARVATDPTPVSYGQARFVVDSQGTVTDLGPRVATGRPIVIGEDMRNRVIPAAERMGADYYAPPQFRTDGQSMAHNRYWINEQMNQGRGIIDVGPAPGRAQYPEPTSPYYQMERDEMMARSYSNYVQREP